jgi:hypothetical protein
MMLALDGLSARAANRTECHLVICGTCSSQFELILEALDHIRSSLRTVGAWRGDCASIWVITSGRQAAFYISGDGNPLTGVANSKPEAIRFALLSYAKYLGALRAKPVGGDQATCAA